MQAILCDICEQPIRGEATEIHFIRGEAVAGEEGRPRVVQRGGASMRYACKPCSSWIDAAITHLRQSLTTIAV